MKLVAYGGCPHSAELSPKASKFYGRMGITESFLREVRYAGPHEAAWAFLARRWVGRCFSEKLRAALAKEGLDAQIEERSKKLKRIIDKLTRSDRQSWPESSLLSKVLQSIHLPAPRYSIGSIRDMYGIRVILTSSETSRDACYDVLEIVLRVAGITDASRILSIMDRLAYRVDRFGPDGVYLGRYESLHVSIPYAGVPIEIQIRDTAMDYNAKNLVKRDGLDR